MAPAILLEEFPIITNGKVQTRYGTVSGYGYGDSMGVEMDYTDRKSTRLNSSH